MVPDVEPDVVPDVEVDAEVDVGPPGRGPSSSSRGAATPHRRGSGSLTYPHHHDLDWLVTDFKAPIGELDLSKAKTLIEYMGPAPPKKTGKHRYVLLLFRNGKKNLPTPSGR